MLGRLRLRELAGLAASIDAEDENTIQCLPSTERRRGEERIRRAIEEMTTNTVMLGLLCVALLARADDYQAKSHSPRQQRKVFIPPPQSIIADETYRHQAVKRFHLGEHLSRPRVRHLSDDSEDLKRLKRNAERLGRGGTLVKDDSQSLGAANSQRDLGVSLTSPGYMNMRFQTSGVV